MAPHSKIEVSDNMEIIGNSSSSSMSSTERRARFSLNMEEKVVLIESHKDYSKEEFKQYYWTLPEQVKLRVEQLSTIARMEKGKKAKKDDYRGLESQQVAMAFERKRTKCLAAVLTAQAEQGKSNAKCPVSLANVSKMVTAESTKKALLIAQADAQDAENAWNVEPQKRRKSFPKRILSKLMIRSNSCRN